jgi:thiamine pyrophosphokinase
MSRAVVGVDTVVVLAGGPKPSAQQLASLPTGAPIVAADRGAEHALALGLDVAVAVGDFDSISPKALVALERSGARLERYSREKDATDLELALDAAVAFGPRRIVVVGSATGRFDHLLGGIIGLAAEALASIELDALLGGATVHVIRGERDVRGSPRELVSLLPLTGDVSGVRTEGLVYPLRGELLRAGSSRGVSNIFQAAEARIVVEAGVLIAVRPGRRVALPVFRNACRSVQEGTGSA